MTYLEALRELLRRVEDGEPIALCDDDTLGNKSTSCHWGFCSAELAHVKKREQKNCPFDKEAAGEFRRFGCFWRCRLFKGRSGYARLMPTPNEVSMALQILKEAISKAEKEQQDGNA